MFDLKWDRRTLFNILKFPLIILIRVPVVLFFRGIAYIDDYSEVVIDKLPAWVPRY
jgi:hypothetical protein